MRWIKKLFRRKRGATQCETYWVIPPYSPAREVSGSGSFSGDA